MVTRLICIAIIIVSMATLPVAAQDDDGCTVDLSTVNALLADAEEQLADDNLDDALALLTDVQTDLQSILDACTGFDINALNFSETLRLRRVFNGGNVTMRYPAGWHTEIGERSVIFANTQEAITAANPEPDHIVGGLTILLPGELDIYDLPANYGVEDVAEVLALRITTEFDAASVSNAETIAFFLADGAILSGSATEDNVTINVVYGAIPVGTGYAFLFLTTIDETVPLDMLLSLMMESLALQGDLIPEAAATAEPTETVEPENTEVVTPDESTTDEPDSSDDE